jgi:hypothetical protein|tara:strand:+ start:2064 stop:2312 length:249 start_codon:yes stop_codon:yes gene_type:complete
MAVDEDLLVVMNTIDETRDHMSEGKYLKTCNSLKRIHKKLKRPSLPHLNEIQIPITKKILYLFTVTMSAVKLIESIKKKITV